MVRNTQIARETRETIETRIALRNRIKALALEVEGKTPDSTEPADEEAS